MKDALAQSQEQQLMQHLLMRCTLIRPPSLHQRTLLTQQSWKCLSPCHIMSSSSRIVEEVSSTNVGVSYLGLPRVHPLESSNNCFGANSRVSYFFCVYKQSKVQIFIHSVHFIVIHSQSMKFSQFYLVSLIFSSRQMV